MQQRQQVVVGVAIILNSHDVICYCQQQLYERVLISP